MGGSRRIISFVLGGDTASNVLREFLPKRGFGGGDSVVPVENGCHLARRTISGRTFGRKPAFSPASP